jgi:hypothetical protein
LEERLAFERKDWPLRVERKIVGIFGWGCAIGLCTNSMPFEDDA